MSAANASRTVFLRRSSPRNPTQFFARRPASTTTEKASEVASDATAKAKDTASNVQSKASSGLSRVQSSAGSAVSGAASGITSSLSSIGGRTGRLIKFVESMIPPTVYYSRVGLEVSKLVFQGQKMSPPSASAFSSFFQPVTNALRNPASLRSATTSAVPNMTPESVLSRIRNMSRGDLAYGGVIFAEVLGFFTVGEVIGRMKLVGYRGDAHAHETATPHN